MKKYMIGYDLNQPRENDDYTNLIEEIKSFENWWHCLDSTWIIKADSTAVEIRNKLSVHIDNGDELLVAQLQGDSAWVGFDDDCSNWLKNN